MVNLFAQIHQELSQGRDLCLATIVNQIGSAPRGLGTSFLVRADGSIAGTIGGGRLEADTITAARQALADRQARLIHFRLRGKEVAETDMLCGGEVDIYLEPLSGGDQEAIELYGQAARLVARGGRALMVTPILPGPVSTLAGRRVLIQESGEVIGSLSSLPELVEELSQGLDELLAQGKPGLGMRTLPDGSRLDYFLEPIRSRPVVYLFGGGHVSQKLAPLISLVGFGLVVIDDRPEFANRELFPTADELWVKPFPQALQGVELPPESYLVIITRGHIHDKEVLAQALRTDAVYVGMIGSRRKRNLIYRTLEEEGFTRQQLEAVHSPIGLDIGAETPEEIAVSIVAELIAVRAGRYPKRHRGPGV